MISFEEFALLFESANDDSEFEIYFHDEEDRYMIIKYDDHVSIQRCDVYDGSGEYEYPSLLELYQSVTVDDICLKEQWDTIETIIADACYDLSLPEELEAFKDL